VSVRSGEEDGLVRENLGVLLNKPFALSKQVHGNFVRVISDDNVDEVFEADGMVSKKSGMYLCVLVADCAPIGFYDPEKQVIGIAHAGWRGTVAGVSGSVVEKMKTEFNSDPANILAFIGPAIGSGCYEVGEEVIRSAQKNDVGRAVHENNGRFFFSLSEANKIILGKVGIRGEHITGVNDCTHCNSEYFSFRRNGTKSRFVAGIVLNNH